MEKSLSNLSLRKEKTGETETAMCLFIETQLVSETEWVGYLSINFYTLKEEEDTYLKKKTETCLEPSQTSIMELFFPNSMSFSR